jgi:predicted PurR-regulated permease PerM
LALIQGDFGKGGCGSTEGLVDFIRARGQVRHALVISDPLPVDSVNKMWASAGQAATIGIFLLLFGAFLYVGQAILLPVLAAAVVSMTLAPLVRAARHIGIPAWVTGPLIVLAAFGALSLAASALAGPVSEWIGRAPEIGASIKAKLFVLEQPLASLRELQSSLFGGQSAVNVSPSASTMVFPVVAAVTPAAAELVLFFTTLLFFLIGQRELRNAAVTMFSNHAAKLRFLKIMRDIERNLAGYLTVVTIVNAGVGAVVALGAWLIGFPNAPIFGLLAALLNYVPYIGPAVMVVVLFSIGLVSFDSLSHARRAHHPGGTFHHADHCRTPPHAQSAPRLPVARVLDLDVGAVGCVSRGADLDHRACRLQPFVSRRGGAAARMRRREVKGTFSDPRRLLEKPRFR